MYVEKTTAEERGIIGSKVEGLIIQFDTCQTLLQDIVENGFKFKSGEATECKIDPELLWDRLWIISNLMLEQWFDIGEVKRIEKALSDRAAKLDLMVKNDHGNFYLTDLNNCAVAPCPMTLEQIDSWLTDLEKQAEQEDKQ